MPVKARHESPVEMIAVKFWAAVEKTDACWTWVGGTNNKGYGRFAILSRWYLAHRLAWWLDTGEWPGHMQVLHSCDNPVCVRPDHLFLGTHAGNMADAASKGRTGPQRYPAKYKRVIGLYRKTRCKYGHDFTPENTLIDKAGAQQCRICRHRRNVENSKLWKARRKAAALAAGEQQ